MKNLFIALMLVSSFSAFSATAPAPVGARLDKNCNWISSKRTIKVKKKRGIYKRRKKPTRIIHV